MRSTTIQPNGDAIDFGTCTAACCARVGFPKPAASEGFTRWKPLPRHSALAIQSAGLIEHQKPAQVARLGVHAATEIWTGGDFGGTLQGCSAREHHGGISRGC